MNIQCLLAPVGTGHLSHHEPMACDAAFLSGAVSQGWGRLVPDAMIVQVLGPMMRLTPDRWAVLAAEINTQIPAHDGSVWVSQSPHQVMNMVWSYTRGLTLNQVDMREIGTGITGLLRGAKRTCPGSSAPLRVRHQSQGMRVTMTQYRQLEAEGMEESQRLRLGIIITSTDELQQYEQAVGSSCIHPLPPIVEIDDAVSVQGRSFRSMNLSGCELSNRDLRACDFSGANLEGARLEKANLEGAQFEAACLRKAMLRNACFKNADLEGADLEGAIVVGARFDQADLSDAMARGSHITSDQLKSCLSFDGMLLTATEYLSIIAPPSALGGGGAGQAPGVDRVEGKASPPLEDHEWCALRMVISTPEEWAQLHALRFKPKVMGIDRRLALANCLVLHWDMSGAQLAGHDFRGAHCCFLELEQADLSQARFEKSVLYHVNLDRAILRNWQGNGMGCRSVHMRWSILQGADVSNAQFEDVDFSNSDMTGITVHGTVFLNVRLVNVNLSGVDMRGMKPWVGVTMRECNVIGAQWSLAQWQGCVDCDGSLVSVADYRRIIALGVSLQLALTLCVQITCLNDWDGYQQFYPLPRVVMASKHVLNEVVRQFNPAIPVHVSFYQALWECDPERVGSTHLDIPHAVRPCLCRLINQLENNTWVDMISQYTLDDWMAQAPPRLVLLLPSLNWEHADQAYIYEEQGIRQWLECNDHCPRTRGRVSDRDLIPLEGVIRSWSIDDPRSINQARYPRVWHWWGGIGHHTSPG